MVKENAREENVRRKIQVVNEFNEETGRKNE